MKSLGDKIRDAIVEKLSGGDKRKRTEAMDKAAQKLKISKAGLYNKLNAAEIPVDFIEKLEKILEINVEELKNQDDDGVEIIGADKASVYSIPIKNKRRAKLVMPADADGEDVKLIIKHLNLFETHF